MSAPFPDRGTATPATGSDPGHPSALFPRLRLAAPLLLLLGLLLRPLAQPKDEPPVPLAPDSTVAADTAAADSVWRPEFVLRQGPLFTGISRHDDRLWLCGDSGLVAYSRDDSTWTRVAGAIRHLPFNDLVAGPEGILAAGDSGAVMIVSGDTLLPRSLPDGRDISRLLLEKGVLYACGGGGLVASSRTLGRDWTVGTLPEPARCLSQLLHEGRWIVGGTGGFLYSSPDGGVTWQRIPRRDYTPIVDLLASGPDVLLALRDGRLERMDAAGTFTPVDQAPWGDAYLLHGLEDGWLLAGSGGRMLVQHGQQRRELRLDSYSLFSDAVSRPGGVLLCGNRGLLAGLDTETDSLVALHNSLVDRVALTAAAPLADTLAVAAQVTGLPRLDVSADSTLRLFSLLDGNPGVSDNQNKLDRLARNYNQAGFLGEAGFAILMVDVDAGGRLERGRVLDEYPRNLGFGSYAQEILNSLEFTPGVLEGKFVRTRLLFSMHFPRFTNADNPWHQQDDFSPGALLDSLSGLWPRVVSGLPLKEFVKRMDFPRKARRYSWEGECLLSFELRPGMPPDSVILLRETPVDLGFGEHSLAVLPELALRGDSLEAPFTRLHVKHRLHYDRRQASKPAKAEAKGHRFSESLYTVALVDSTDFTPGLANLKSVIRDFLGDSLGTGTIELTVNLRPDGIVDDAEAIALSGDFSPEFLASLRDFILLFGWGYPTEAERGSPIATAKVRLDLPLPDTLPPAPIAPLFEGVTY